MKKTGTRSLVQGACVFAVLAAIAIPLSNLMVAETTAETAASAVAQPVVSVASEVADVESSDTSSAVSALMAGSAVGPSRGAVVAPRHPASAYIP